MARCRCNEGTCSCYLVPGANIEVSGSGQADNPWIITGLSQSAGTIFFNDTPEVDFTVTGFGSMNDPYRVSAALPWVDPAPGATGNVLTKQADGNWAAAPAVVVGPGDILTDGLIVGDGTVGDPLRLAVCTYGDLKLLCTP